MNFDDLNLEGKICLMKSSLKDAGVNAKLKFSILNGNYSQFNAEKCLLDLYKSTKIIINEDSGIWSEQKLIKIEIRTQASNYKKSSEITYTNIFSVYNRLGREVASLCKEN